MKKILGLDLGTNSIGWALVEQDFDNKQGKILGMGSRIIPMTQDRKDDFGKGNSISQTAERTRLRSVRRLRERHLLRRERLHRVLNILGFLPEHYASEIDFEQRYGKFVEGAEPKIAWKKINNKKSEFLFQNSFLEMLEEFKLNGHHEKVPYDWTIYYLRKKALSSKVKKEELAWIILNFNQKRGYYQLRGEDIEDDTKTAKTRKYFDKKTIVDIIDTNEVYKGLKVLLVELEDGNKGKIFKKEIPDWIGTEKNIIATVDIDKDGNDKYEDNGLLSQRFSIPTDEQWETEWKLIKLKTEKDLKDSGHTVGAYIYTTLLRDPNQKVRGKLVRTIERKFYKEELSAILRKQIALQPELFTEELYNDCVRELYRNNEAHQQTLSRRDFVHLFVEDIIFYQRPLRSKKSTIGNCPLESRPVKDINGMPKTDEKGRQIMKTFKVISKSHPLYQEFRLWQWLYNLRIHSKETDLDVTEQFLQSIDDYEQLFEFLNNRKEIKQEPLLKYLLERRDPKSRALSKESKKFRWNYIEDKAYPCNETGAQIETRLTKVKGVPPDFKMKEVEIRLWHIIYSVTDKEEFEKALRSFAIKYDLDADSFVENFKNFPPFSSEYGSFSEKAIKKLLPLLRIGKYWKWENIDVRTQTRIDKILTGEFDENMRNRVREKAISLSNRNDFQGLQLWLASYVVYDKHAEANVAGKWNTVGDLEKYLEEFKQHALRNPIVEQVITETLRVVKDIWRKYGGGAKDFFDEIHIELGRDLKRTVDERKHMTRVITENENTNLRIKALLIELLNDGNVENVRPFSPMQQEALKIYEDGALSSDENIPDDIAKISKMSQPTSSELQRYKLWLEQRYRSAYTGIPIPLSKLFTTEYEIEHIIPQSRYFDDSFNNKIICESAVNALKDRQLALEFIKQHSGEIVQDGSRSFRIFTEDEYKDFIKDNYAKNRAKRNKLLLDEIPDEMIQRQMNDTRYISKFISHLLSNIVREGPNDDGVNSKNLLFGNGKITSTLRHDWGLNDVWNDLILPRFERMNRLTNSTAFTVWNERYQKKLPIVPMEYSKGFQKKRIDHRHHAMDALIVACATRDHINLLNNESAKSDTKRYDLQRKLRHTGKWQDRNGKERDKFTEFKKPWDTFTVDTRDELEKMVVSFKPNLRVINKTTNKYEKWVRSNGKLVKELVPQTKGDSWAIRKPLHKDTVSGEVKLAHVKVPRGKILTATRKNIDTSFNLKTIEAITDTGIQTILKNYLKSKDDNPKLAFTPEGLEEMNRNIQLYNNGKKHQPIYKARIYEVGSKFPLGQTGNKNAKFVEAAKGTNLFFAIYQGDKGKRTYETIPLNVVIERQKQGLGSVPEVNDKNHPLLFHLSPNDLVYIPTEEEQDTINQIDFSNLSREQLGRIYKMVSSTGNQCFFIRQDIATSIVNKLEYSPLNKMEKTIEGVMIKEHCIKLKVDRLGNLSRA